MSYLDAVRFKFVGDRAKGMAHQKFARNMLFGLVRRTVGSGADSARMTRFLPGGVVVEVLLAGMIATATVYASVGGGEEASTIAFVAHNGTTPPTISVVDVDREKLLYNFSGLGQVTAMQADPQGRFVYILCYLTPYNPYIVKFNVFKKTATGVALGFGVPMYDLMINPQGTILYARFPATGAPGVDGTWGAVWRFKAEDLSFITNYPNTLFSSLQFSGDVHPNGQVYLTVYGDGDGNTDYSPGIGTYSAQHALESYTETAFVVGEVFTAPHIGSGNGFKKVVIDGKGERLYTASDSPYRFFANGGADVPTFLAYNVEDGGMTRITSMLVGEELTGHVAINHTGSVAFVVRRLTGEVQTILVGNDDFTLGPTFKMRDDDVTFSESNFGQTIRPGPRNGSLPDQRMYFLSSPGRTLWAFNPGSTKPDKKIAFEEAVFTMALVRAAVTETQ